MAVEYLTYLPSRRQAISVTGWLSEFLSQNLPEVSELFIVGFSIVSKIDFTHEPPRFPETIFNNMIGINCAGSFRKF